MASNTRPPRFQTAERIADLLKELASVEDLTAPEAAELMDTKNNTAYKWLDALEEVGLVEKGTPRRKSPEARGFPAATYKLAKWVRAKVA